MHIIKFRYRKLHSVETIHTKCSFLTHRQPKLKMLGVQCNVTYAMLHNYAKRDSRLTTYGGIVLQRFEFVKVCMGRKRLCWKSQQECSTTNFSSKVHFVSEQQPGTFKAVYG